MLEMQHCDICGTLYLSEIDFCRKCEQEQGNLTVTLDVNTGRRGRNAGRGGEYAGREGENAGTGVGNAGIIHLEREEEREEECGYS